MWNACVCVCVLDNNKRMKNVLFKAITQMWEWKKNGKIHFYAVYYLLTPPSLHEWNESFLFDYFFATLIRMTAQHKCDTHVETYIQYFYITSLPLPVQCIDKRKCLVIEHEHWKIDVAISLTQWVQSKVESFSQNIFRILLFEFYNEKITSRIPQKSDFKNFQEIDYVERAKNLLRDLIDENLKKIYEEKKIVEFRLCFLHRIG